MSPARLDPRFRLISPLGQGGTAEVARVWVNDLGREAALKYPLPDQPNDQPDFAGLAAREYELIGGLRFPGLVRLLEKSHINPDYLLLELCQGKTLDQLGRIDKLEDALDLLSAVAITLEFLRARGIVHGDLKPQNIFLPRGWQTLSPGSLFYAKLSDFSLGRRDSESEEKRAGLGTVGFMAPEIISKTQTSHQSDLFAFGVMAYQLLTGVHPFLNEDTEPVKVNGRIQEEVVPGIDQIRPELAGNPVVALIDKLLTKDPSSRPRTALEGCEQLEKAGATYPYRKAIRPGHLIDRRRSYGENCDQWFLLDETERQSLGSFTGGSVDELVLLTSSNFQRGNLVYESGRFRFQRGVWWPSMMRRSNLSAFAGAPLNQQKDLVRNAVTAADRPTELLVKYLLRPSTIRRISTNSAKSAERSEKYELAVTLHVQAGEFESAERCAYQAATLLARDSHWKPALSVVDRVIELAHLKGQESKAGQLFLLKGTILKDSGDTIRAEQVYRELVALLENGPPDQTLGIVYNKLGDLHKKRREFAEGLAALEKALAIFEKLGDELEYSHTCNNLGNIHWLTADHAKSVWYYRRALRCQRKLNATADIATTLNNLGIAYAAKGYFRRGIAMFNIALKLKRELGHAGEIARTLNNLGYAHHILGQNTKALEFLSESLELNRRIGSRKEIMINLENLTSIMISAGRLRASLEPLKEGLELSRELGDETQEIIFNISTSTVLMRLGKLGNAVVLLGAAGKALAESDDRIAANQHTLALAQWHLLTGDDKEAVLMAERALKTATESNDSNSRLSAILLLERLVDSPDLPVQAEQIIREMHYGRMRTVMAFHRAERMLRGGDHEAALSSIGKYLQDALAMEEDADGASLCLIAAECLINNQRSQEALPYVLHARRQASESGLANELLRCGVLMGRLNIENRDIEEAFKEYKRAFQIAKDMSVSLTRDTDRAMFQQRREVKYLVEEIKRLGLMLGQKKQAGTKPARA